MCGKRIAELQSGYKAAVTIHSGVEDVLLPLNLVSS